MAPSGCELDDAKLAEQIARYQHLSANVLGVDRDGPRARVLFDEWVDTGLIQQTLSVERGCCSFFTLDYDPSDRVFSIATEPDRDAALSALLSLLIPAAGPAAGRGTA